MPATKHQHHFEDLSPDDFERLVYWLVKRSGEFDQVQWYGGARDKGRDVVTYKHAATDREKWYIQCKRYEKINFATLHDELDKLAQHTKAESTFAPDVIVFATACSVPPQAKDQAANLARKLGLPEPYYWGRLELDERLKAQPDTQREFFFDEPGSQTEKLHAYLAHAVSAYEARMHQIVDRSTIPLDRPYKFLYAFEIEDADIFFGRDAASDALYQTVLKDRLTVLHAKSGAGKTSLLNAGLSPRIIREDRLPVYARAYENPVRAIKRAIAPPSLGPWPELLPKLTLPEFLGLACANLGQAQELVIILDQFEEFFVFWPERDQRQPFIDALADCYDDKTLPIRFILALRKDYYSDLTDFQRRIPTVFYNEYRLDTMRQEEASAAITKPAAKMDRPVVYTPDLLKVLLDDLARGGIELPHLQIICTSLYKALAENETEITLASYRQMGQTEGILGSYLNSVLDEIPGKGAAIAKDVLKELVSSEATKRVLSHEALAMKIDADRDELDNVLDHLIDARLLRRSENAGDANYELAHEYLIKEIKTWIDQEGFAFKQVEEMLKREVENWEHFGTLIAADKLALVDRVRERLQTDAKTYELLLRSALAAQHKSSIHWLGRIETDALRIRIIQDYLRDGRPSTRSWVAQTMTTWDAPEVSDLLADLALQDPEALVRKQATLSLIKWSNPAFAVIALMSTRGASLERINEALAHILNEADVWPSLPRKTRMQVTQVLLLRRLEQAALTLLYRTLAGGSGATVSVALVAALLAYLVYPRYPGYFYKLPLPSAMALLALVGGLLGSVQGGATAFGITLADVLVRKPSTYFRLIGGTTGGWALGIIIALMALVGFLTPETISQTDFITALIATTIMGMLISGGSGLAIPELGVRRSLFAQTIGGIIAMGGICAVVMGGSVLILSIFDKVQYNLMAVLGCSILEGVLGGGMALGLGIASRLTRNGKEKTSDETE